jgi:serine/threonine-protein kinase
MKSAAAAWRRLPGNDVKHDRDVALKVLSPDLHAPLGVERFLREIAFTARLDHPHILPLLDSGESGGLLYYVMPLVDGESLRDRLKRGKQLPIDEALQITREIASALSHAHGQGVLHRDIKPENIMLSGGHARVADFGIGRAMSATVADNLTVTGLAVGTPTYMSPEQASGASDVDARADVYSLACMLYEMLAGQPPYTASSTAALLARKSLEPMPRCAPRETRSRAKWSRRSRRRSLLCRTIALHRHASSYRHSAAGR